MSYPTPATFTHACSELAQLILQKEPELRQLLCRYETHATVDDEIERSIEALNGVGTEFAPLKHPLHGLTIVTFFPLNLPLYSLVLFGIIPSFFSKHVFIRPPEVMHETLLELSRLLGIEKRFPALSVHAVPRYTFMELYAQEADVIVFTGKYENALSIRAQCPQALLVYNGSGINPFVVFEDADLDLAVQKAVEMRCFNSGQDCAGPDAFFVPASLADEFIGKLQDKLAPIQVGDSADPSVTIGKTIKTTYIDQLNDVLEREHDRLVYGGQVDAEHHFVYPAIIRKDISEHIGGFHEFFAPVFYVLEYTDTAALEKVLLSEAFRERTMYVSTFGTHPTIIGKLTFAKVLREQIVNDVERGNEAYGGWGDKANFLLYGSKKLVQPVLISRDMHKVL